ncbi:protease inhibitor/seed storage/lipid transfer family protein [Salix suchowensis]|nr:protease inhibitor/seed storage/lipid transfer family protein [Salix suchowensis]
MANSNVQFIMIFAILAVTGALIPGNKIVALGQECDGDFQGLITQCTKFVQRQGSQTDPSPECCNVIKTLDVPCVCQHVTDDIQAVIDMAKVAHVAQYCGIPLAHGTTCGNTTWVGPNHLRMVN